MNAPRPGPSAPADRPACAHCGLPVPASLLRPGEEKQFCCQGCRQVHTLVQEWGLDQYYRLAAAEPQGLAPARVSGREFEELDD
ncbi:MAG TPA: heavy metal translocating P-type ATPase metal-binding domain-containing protein, partial [Thermoanaerobaculia bacterium]|nr:heavy metal translocating P-type ATPase metal-binding domain-containing protein [Thermoanaerobaculia bacterium]